jgi:hypothetical protein
MSTANFVPKIWAATIMRTLEDNLIARQVCSTEFTGEIKKRGDTVYFEGLADPTISQYTGVAITYENLQDSRVSLVVDQADMFAFKVGDIEKVQANMDMKGSQAQRAAYGLKKQCDTNLMALYPNAGTTVTAASITTANILSFLGAFQQKLAEANVPESEMWMILPPWMKLKLTLAGIKFQIQNGINGTGTLAYTKELGFDVYATNNVKNTGTVPVPISQIMAGSKNAVAFADQITESEDIRLESTFDTAVRGLHTYGFKVVKPIELVTGAATFAAESTI